MLPADTSREMGEIMAHALGQGIKRCRPYTDGRAYRPENLARLAITPCVQGISQAATPYSSAAWANALKSPTTHTTGNALQEAHATVPHSWQTRSRASTRLRMY